MLKFSFKRLFSIYCLPTIALPWQPANGRRRRACAVRTGRAGTGFARVAGISTMFLPFKLKKERNNKRMVLIGDLIIVEKFRRWVF